MKKMLSRIMVTTFCTVTLVGLASTAASAGEITGNGKFKAVNAKSICAYSGQNDGFHDPEHVEGPGDELNRVQSYGQIVRTGGQVPDFARPGSACNGHSGFLSEPEH